MRYAAPKVTESPPCIHAAWTRMLNAFKRVFCRSFRSWLYVQCHCIVFHQSIALLFGRTEAEKAIISCVRRVHLPLYNRTRPDQEGLGHASADHVTVWRPDRVPLVTRWTQNCRLPLTAYNLLYGVT
jgi:hypothetical protein